MMNISGHKTKVEAVVTKSVKLIANMIEPTKPVKKMASPILRLGMP